MPGANGEEVSDPKRKTQRVAENMALEFPNIIWGKTAHL